MRTREDYSRVPPDSTSTSSFYTSGSGSVTQRYEPVPMSYRMTSFQTLFEASTDLVPGNNRSSWNAFEHYKRSAVPVGDAKVPYASWFYLAADYWYDKFHAPRLWWYSDAPFGPRENPTFGLPPLYAPSVSSFVPLPDGTNLFVQKALCSMLPGIKPDLSLVNSIIELKDFKSLPKTVKRINSLVVKGKATLRQVMKASADAFLQKEFNIMPLLQDICDIVNVMYNTRKKIENLLRRENTTLTRHYTAELSTQDGNVDVWTPTAKPMIASPYNTYMVWTVSDRVIGSSAMKRTVKWGKCQLHAEIQYSYRFNALQRELANVLGFLDALGVNLNPAIIWNAIPWSFVVDWVFGVSRWLNTLQIANMKPVTHIHQFLYSVSYSRTIDIYQRVGIGSPAGMNEGAQVHVTEDAYRRVVGFDGIPNALRITGISPKEFILGSALAVTRKRRR